MVEARDRGTHRPEEVKQARESRVTFRFRRNCFVITISSAAVSVRDR
jgi:hypothetical protein